MVTKRGDTTLKSNECFMPVSLKNNFVLICVTVLHGDPGMKTRGLEQTGVLMDEERRRYRNTGKDINISVDINNNRQETWGRADYK